MSDDDEIGRSGPSNPWHTVPEVASRPQTMEAGGTASVPPVSLSEAETRNFDGEVVFDDRLKGLAPLAIKGYLLTMITMGIYRFWYVTDLRRYFWSRTSVQGSPLEYTGRGIEIFIGFLIALAVVLPLYALSFGLTVSLGTAGQLATFALAPVYALLIFFATYRSRRYRMNRTLWRGLRAHQTGSGWGYAFRAFGWMLLVIVTFGLAVPWMEADLHRYRVERMYLGNVPFSFRGDWKLIAKPFGLVWLIFAFPLVLGILGMFLTFDFVGAFDAMVPADDGTWRFDRTRWQGDFGWAPALAGFGMVWMFSGFLAVPYYIARRTSAFYSATELHGIKCSTEIPAGSLYWIYFMFGLLFVLIFVVGAPVIAGLGFLIVAGLNAATGSTTAGGIFAVVGIIASYLGFFIAFGLLSLLYLQRRMWALVAGSIIILNPALLDDLAGRMRDGEDGFGAGFADALDVGDFDVGF